jgi:hypothetical protein
MPHPSHLPWFEHPNICCTVQIMKLIIMNYFQPPVTSSSLGSNILLSTHSQMPSICVLLMRYQVSHPYKTSKIIVLYTLILTFFRPICCWGQERGATPPHPIHLHGMVLNKYQGQFAFTFSVSRRAASCPNCFTPRERAPVPTG